MRRSSRTGRTAEEAAERLRAEAYASEYRQEAEDHPTRLARKALAEAYERGVRDHARAIQGGPEPRNPYLAPGEPVEPGTSRVEADSEPLKAPRRGGTFPSSRAPYMWRDSVSVFDSENGTRYTDEAVERSGYLPRDFPEGVRVLPHHLKD